MCGESHTDDGTGRHAMADPMTRDFMRFLAAWALVHETADEGWRAAVERGRSAGPEA
jgi:hypothetical protein